MVENDSISSLFITTIAGINTQIYFNALDGLASTLAILQPMTISEHLMLKNIGSPPSSVSS